MATNGEMMRSILAEEKARARENIHKKLSEAPFDDDPDSEKLLNDVLGCVRDSEAPQLLEKSLGEFFRKTDRKMKGKYTIDPETGKVVRKPDGEEATP